MYYTQSKLPSSFSNYQKYDSALKRVREAADKDGEKMSPVNLCIEDSLTIQLPVLEWTNYHLTPSAMAVKNTGFTVMISAKFEDLVPSVSSGPLAGNYIFSQVHFHWGEHDRTGSGHAADGIRYPLEMHIVHMKKDCPKLGDALKTNDGIVVMVHLFTLREERNTQLDQLTAILQFIQKPKDCARLYPTPLSEIVQPFNSDYFLYWGAVGSPKGQYRILWFISRNVLPISTQQLNEFRQLRDPDGNMMVTNANKPVRLIGRTLFLVSPSESTKETMHGVSSQTKRVSDDLDDESSREITNAEYKSLADLEEMDINSCKICPTNPKRVTHVANINVGPYMVNEGDTSVEESCMDLNYDTDDRFTVITETKLRENFRTQKVITNVNVSRPTGRNNCRANRRQSREEIYKVISQRGSQWHIRRKPLVVRQTDPSTEQACMFLSVHSNTRSTCSAPSLSSTDYPLAIKQEHTHLASLPLTNNSSELAVHHRDSEIGLKINDFTPGDYYYEEFENETTHRKSLNQSKKRIIIKGRENSKYDSGIKNQNQPKTLENGNVVPSYTYDYTNTQSKPKSTKYNEYFENELILSEEGHDRYFIAKKIAGNKPRYKVVEQIPDQVLPQDNKGLITNFVDPNSHVKDIQPNNTQANRQPNRADVGLVDPDKRVYENSEELFQNYQEEKNERKEYKHGIQNRNKTSTNVKQEDNQQEKVKQNHTVEKLQPREERKLKEPEDKQRQSEPHYRVSLRVHTTISDHRNTSKKTSEKKQKFYVAKIIPVEDLDLLNSSNIGKETSSGNQQTTADKLYYAKPITDDGQQLLKGSGKSPNRKNGRELSSEYYETVEELHSKKIEASHKIMKTGQNKINENPETKQLPEELVSEGTVENKRENVQRQDKSQVISKDKPSSVPDETMQLTNKPEEDNKYTIYKEKDNNLDKNVNVYHGQNDKKEDVYVIDKTVTGKIGQSNSTDVFVKTKKVEVIGPNNKELQEGVDYSLVKNKQTESQSFTKEPTNKSKPIAVIRQHISLDQQITGRSQIRQSVEYNRDRRPMITTNVRPANETPQQQESKEDNSNFSVIETVEESNQEQSSTVKKTTKHIFKTDQPQTSIPIDPSSKLLTLDNANNMNSIEKEKEYVLKYSAVDPKSLILSDHKKESIDPVGSKNTEINSYQTTEKSSVNEITKSLKREKTVIFKANEDTNQETPQTLLPSGKPGKEASKISLNGNMKTPKIEEAQITIKDNCPIERKVIITDHEGNEFEEIVEENEVYSSETKKEKTKRVKIKGGVSYKLPENFQNVTKKQSSHHTMEITKVEIPEPQYVTRIPKQPVVEYEAYSVDPHESFEIITETYGEDVSVVKTNKTFMMFKNSNGKAALNQPSVIEPIKIENNEKNDSESFSKTNNNKIVPFKDTVKTEINSVTKSSNLVNEEYETLAQEENSTYNKVHHIKQIKTSNSPNNKDINHTPMLKEPDEASKGNKDIKTNPDTRKDLVQSDPQTNEIEETYSFFEQNVIHKEKKYKSTIGQPYKINNEKSLPNDLKNLLESRISPKADLTPQNIGGVLTDIWGNPENKKLNIVTSSYKRQESSSNIPENRGNEGDPTVVTALQNQNIQPIPHHSNHQVGLPGQYISEEYENTTSSHKYESTKHRYVAVRATLLDGKSGYLDPSTLHNQARLDYPRLEQNKYPDIWDEPTKDSTTDNKVPGIEKENEIINNATNNGRKNGESDPASHRGSNIIPNTQAKVSSGTLPYTKHDGDILIYIRQPKAQTKQISPQITVDLTESNLMTQSEFDSQQVRVHELKKSHKKSKAKQIITPRRSKSAEYHPTLSSDSSVGVGDSNEEIIDTTHYNLTLKSQTKVQLPQGQHAKVKSKAEVKIDPPGPGTQNGNPYVYQAKSQEYSSLDDEDESFLSGTIASDGKESAFNQSPINIKTESSVKKDFPKIEFINQWENKGNALLQNNGKTLKASIKEEMENRPYLKGGPVEGKYIFEELHFHWGHKDCCGAEHIVDGHKHSMEGHFMYFKENYENISEALNYPDGIVIVAVILTVGGPPNLYLSELLKDISLLREANTGCYVPARAVFAWAQPTIDAAKGYFSYKGSLTLETGVETVTWLVFPEAIVFCCQQSCEFRKLKTLKGEPLRKNFRFPQPLNNRPVYYVPIATSV